MSRLATPLPAMAPPRLTPLERCGAVWVKAEGRQPSGSVKQRLVYSLVHQALRAGQLAQRRPLAAVSSGATGVALAMAGRQLRLAVEIHALASTPHETVSAAQAQGAHLVLHHRGASLAGLVDALRHAATRGEVWHLDQYHRARLQRAYVGLAEELIEQLADGGVRPRYFVCPVDTGGVIQGVGSALRAAFPEIAIVAVEPADGQTIQGMRNTERERGLEDTYDRDFPDLRVEVPAPSERTRLTDGTALGASASACVQLAERNGWTDALVVAAD